ncbi:hypothetical protein ES332_A13G052400v1 [Gossypium tomentosum]|uniref:Uncharacterized protein n=1 Tax=Gossypium tomentosum TaxID=34277 RepID=A0A5D2MGK0_GOSTO|nr:hypothetical protein ES332_A13G052400v1 [Gossypium tomentosum]
MRSNSSKGQECLLINNLKIISNPISQTKKPVFRWRLHLSLNPSLHSSLPFLAGPVPANSQGNDPPTPRKLSGNRLYVDAMLLDEFSCFFFV